MGINVGIVAALGNKFDRLGFVVNGYYTKDAIQVNTAFRCYYNFKAIGPKKRYFEATSSIGLVVGYGSLTSDSSFFFNPVSNQTLRKNSLGYAFNFYFNNIGTSQQTGTISIEVDHFNIVAENDLFARPKLDRYRTGAFSILYQNNRYRGGINSSLFTGQMGHKVEDANYPYSHLYKSDIDGKYTQNSHGLISAQFGYVGKHYQTYQGNIGLDAEKVRHAIQNRFIHDMIFLPKKWRRKSNAHIPMIDSEGNQYLFKEDQKIKSTSLYFNTFMNPSIFY